MCIVTYYSFWVRDMKLAHGTNSPKSDVNHPEIKAGLVKSEMQLCSVVQYERSKPTFICSHMDMVSFIYVPNLAWGNLTQRI